jgi:hypothetical protein
MVTKILIQIEDRKETSWLISPEELRHRLEVFASFLIKDVTAGMIPRVTVIQDEAPESKPQVDGNGNNGGAAGASLCRWASPLRVATGSDASCMARSPSPPLAHRHD